MSTEDNSATPLASVATPCRHEIRRAAGLDAHESVFDVDTTRVRFGLGALREVGDAVRAALGHQRGGSRSGARVALFTDARVRQLECFDTAERALRDAGLDVVVYSETLVEPTDRSFEAAARFAQQGTFDAFVSVGGGSVMDTCKAANLLASCGGRLLD